MRTVKLDLPSRLENDASRERLGAAVESFPWLHPIYPLIVQIVNEGIIYAAPNDTQLS